MNHDRTNEYAIPKTMKAWVLGNPEELALVEKPVPEPGAAEVLVRVDAIAVCATDIEILKHGLPAMIDGGLPFNRGFTPGHEYMGTVVRLGPTVDEFEIGDRIAVEVHAGCGRCPRCREGMYTSCLNYGYREKGHRANGFSTDGGFAEYAVNNVNTMVHVPDDMSDEEATLIVTSGTAMYGLDVMGGIIAGEARPDYRPRSDRVDGCRGRQGAGRAARDPDRHPPAPARNGQAPRCGRGRQCQQRGSRRGRPADYPWQGSAICRSNARAHPTLSTRRREWSIAAGGFASLLSRRTR